MDPSLHLWPRTGVFSMRLGYFGHALGVAKLECSPREVVLTAVGPKVDEYGLQLDALLVHITQEERLTSGDCQRNTLSPAGFWGVDK